MIFYDYKLNLSLGKMRIGDYDFLQNIVTI
jgi:hypothetical protein